MRLGTITISATMSAILLSGCSFIGLGGPAKPYKNPFAKQKAAQYGQYAGAANSGHSARGAAAYGQAYGAGFPQQPQFGQPQYTTGSYGAALGQPAAFTPHMTGPRKRKPRLRGSLSLGVEKSLNGDLIDYGARDDLSIGAGYNPQSFNEGTIEGSQAEGSITRTIYTANDLDTTDIFSPNSFESSDAPNIKFSDAWSTPASIKGGAEYILSDKNTVFANAGYTYAQGEELDAATVDATLYRWVEEQAYTPVLDAAGAPIPGSYVPNGAPIVSVNFIPNQRIASFAYDFSDLKQYDFEVGGRHYFDPLVKSEGYKTVTPFVGASIGVSRVNAVDVTISQRQAFYQRAYDGAPGDSTYSVPTSGDATRLYDAQWLPQAQLNLGAEWQVTPGFALAAESGLKVQGSRDYADYTNTAGETVSGRKGDTNLFIPLTLRGSVNF